MKRLDVQDPLRLYTGKQVVDLHGTSATHHLKLNEMFDVRKVVTFSIQSEEGRPSAFHRFLTDINRAYLNKYLIVIAEDLVEPGWFPCAWVYDNLYAGVCEIRRKKV